MSRNAHRRLLVAALFAALPLPLHLARGMTPGHVHGVTRLAAIETAITDCPAPRLFASAIEAPPQVVTWDCNTAGPVSETGGWQAPGGSGGSGDSACQADGAFFLLAWDQAYDAWLRLTPDFANVSIQTEVMRGDRDGADTDGFSLLLHWSGSTSPSACCEPVHAASGLRVFFSLARGRVELTEEIGGASGPLLGTLPFDLPVDINRSIQVNLYGATLELKVDGTPIGTLPIPDTPAAAFGFDARGVNVEFAPFVLTVGCPGDLDCDGLLDASDLCPDVPSADQTDTDGDGVGNPCDPDDDGDGLSDGADHCPLVADPSNADADQDGLGDVCDTCPLDGANDLDHDGHCANVDNCPFETNPGQEDMDLDSEGDVCDLDDGVIFVRWQGNTLIYQHELPFNGYNLYKRDAATLQSSGVYVVDPQSHPGPDNARACDLTGDYVSQETPAPGQAILYFVSGSAGNVDGGLGEDSSGDERPNGYPCGCLPMTRVAHARDGGSFTPSPNLLIDSLAQWCAYMPSLCNAGLIDFNTEVALAHVYAGRDTCADTKISCVEKAGTGVRVESTDIEYNCGCFFVLTSPYDIVKVKRPATAAAFSSTFTRLPCP